MRMILIIIFILSLDGIKSKKNTTFIKELLNIFSIISQLTPFVQILHISLYNMSKFIP